MKFRLKKGKGSVSGFTDAEGITHVPGDIVNLPASCKGETWLEPLESELKVVAAPSFVEAPAVPDAVPLEPEKPKRTRKVKSESS